MKTINYSKSIALVTVALVSVVSFATGANANESGLAANSRAVHFADLDLNSPGDAKVLYRRIRNAAEQVCGDPGSRRLQQVVAAKTCVDHAIVSSVRAVNQVQLNRVAAADGYQVPNTLNVASAR